MSAARSAIGLTPPRTRKLYSGIGRSILNCFNAARISDDVFSSGSHSGNRVGPTRKPRWFIASFSGIDWPP